VEGDDATITTEPGLLNQTKDDEPLEASKLPPPPPPPQQQQQQHQEEQHWGVSNPPYQQQQQQQQQMQPPPPQQQQQQQQGWMGPPPNNEYGGGGGGWEEQQQYYNENHQYHHPTMMLQEQELLEESLIRETDLMGQLDNMTAAVVIMEQREDLHMRQLDVLTERVMDVEAQAAEDRNLLVEYEANCTALGRNLATLQDDLDEWQKRCNDFTERHEVDSEKLTELKRLVKGKESEAEDLAIAIENLRLAEKRREASSKRTQKNKRGLLSWLFGGYWFSSGSSDDEYEEVTRDVSAIMLYLEKKDTFALFVSILCHIAHYIFRIYYLLSYCLDLIRRPTKWQNPRSFVRCNPSGPMSTSWRRLPLPCSRTIQRFPKWWSHATRLSTSSTTELQCLKKTKWY
jgi:hypothetical protein